MKFLFRVFRLPCKEERLYQGAFRGK